jgi:hypothetical protein
MSDFTYAILDGEYLLKGFLHEPIPALAWTETGWVPLHTSLADLRSHEALRIVSDEEAESFMARHARSTV